MPHPKEAPYRHLAPFDNQQIGEEIQAIAGLMFEDFDSQLLEQTHQKIIDLFNGRWPQYKASNTAYHNLEHTLAVVLACARFLHGAMLEGEQIDQRTFCLCIYAAYFHDAGLIQTVDDNIGTGARHTRGHEQRSINMMRSYLGELGMDEDDMLDCSHIIESTILVMPVDEVEFRHPRTALLGRILAAADLMAQMADWAYIEKLALLFKEFEEASIPGFASEIMLLEKTQGFYDFVAKKRLDSLGNVSSFMHAHYRDRLGVDMDPYHEATLANLAFLRDILARCRDDYDNRDSAPGVIWPG